MQVSIKILKTNRTYPSFIEYGKVYTGDQDDCGDVDIKPEELNGSSYFIFKGEYELVQPMLGGTVPHDLDEKAIEHESPTSHNESTVSFEFDEKLKAELKKSEEIRHQNSALSTQIGGNHYKDMKIQPFEFSMANNFNAGQHSVIKYISRYKNKNGKEDLLKARHFIDLMIQLEYPEK